MEILRGGRGLGVGRGLLSRYCLSPVTSKYGEVSLQDTGTLIADYSTISKESHLVRRVEITCIRIKVCEIKSVMRGIMIF